MYKSQEYGVDDANYFAGESNHYELDDSAAHMIRDNNKCILCRRCVAVCEKVQGVGVIGTNNRGFATFIGSAFDMGLGETSCVSCGQCIACLLYTSTREYGFGDNKVVALNHVSFSVEEGEFVTILGPSGSGKSTLLHLLGGVDKPTFGKVYIGGQSIYEMKERELTAFRRREIGQIYQFYNLIPVLNVEENICLPMLLDHRQAERKDLDELLDLLGLTERCLLYTSKCFC